MAARIVYRNFEAPIGYILIELCHGGVVRRFSTYWPCGRISPEPGGPDLFDTMKAWGISSETVMRRILARAVEEIIDANPHLIPSPKVAGEERSDGGRSPRREVVNAL
jgi:hypothetical protein